MTVQSDSTEENAGQTDPVETIKALEHHIEQLQELADAGHQLSHILHSNELYAEFTEIVCSKLGIDQLAVYIYHTKERSFRLSHNRGFDRIINEFKLDDHDLFGRMIQKEMLTRETIEKNDGIRDYFKDKKMDWQAVGAWVPLVMQNDLIGLVILNRTPEDLSGDKHNLTYLKDICAHATVCIHTCLLYEMRQREKEDLDKTLYNLSLLYNIGRAMTHISDLKSLLKYILNQAIEVTQAEKGSIMLHDPDTNQLSIRVLAGLEDSLYQERVNNNEIKCKSFLPGEGVAGQVFETGQAVFVNRTGENDAFVESTTSFAKSIACIPMHVYSEIIGVINVTNKKNKAGFSNDDIEMLTAVADQAAVSISKAQLWEMAVKDSLTGLHVRRYFMARLQDEIHRTERYKNSLSVVMADLDHFKAVNDTYGHTSGDQVLRAVGKFLHDSVRDVDSVGRYGGEEFIMFLPETSKDAAQLLSERLRKGVAAIELGNLPGVTVSMGIATFPEDGKTIEELLKKADAALYAAKERGRNKVAVYIQEITIPNER